ncbi:MAG TPA: hypothetical protein VKA98_08170 [Nitrososphaeraceae archaeon]|nr:hypothetical protein [Nitrososphaeraceae archaeon]
MKSRNWKWCVLLGAAISITLATPWVASSIDFVLQNATGQEEEGENTIDDVNFSPPLDNIFQIGTRFLVEYDNIPV